MLRLPKKTIFYFLFTSVFLLGLFTYLFLATKLLAQEPIPDPPVLCPETRDEEYHSLRPYQASATCVEPSEIATYCGNDLVLQDTVKGYYDPNNPECKQIEPKKAICSFSIDRHRNFAIDVSGVDFPIAGNTEDIINSQIQDENLNDADKVNEYVSWYLNGTLYRAEYPFIDIEKEEDLQKIVNFSGPLNKLLPQRMQKEEKLKTIESVVQIDLNNDEVIENKDRHDQVVGCVKNLLGGIDKAKIVECYPSSADKSTLRISDWEKHLPPLEEDYEKPQDYYIAYKRWRGESCLKFPIINVVFCFDNFLKPNYWGNLFSYIPYSSTEDLEGSLQVKSGYVQTASENTVVSNVVVNSSPAPLYFAHQQENTELAKLLQTTYVAKDNLGNNEVDHKLVDVKGSDHCSLAQVRSNPGDNLFPGEISVDLSYKIDFSCEFNVSQYEEPIYDSCNRDLYTCYPESWDCPGPRIDCPAGYVCLPYDSCQEPTQDLFCEKIANVYLSTETKTPNANTIWGQFVAGASSVFKRFFPKMGEENSPVRAVLDIPAASKVTYTTSDGTPIYVENPAQRLDQSPELYFPHLGGVQEYFLRAIQTALRPKGYGYDIASGEPSTGYPGDQMCEAPSSPPDAVGAPKCDLGVGYCSPENLRRFFPDDRSAKQASIICNAESGGDPSSVNCGCLYGTSVDYSIGLFQINLLAHCAADAFHFTWNPPSCTILDEEKVNACAEKYFDADENTRYARQLYDQVGWEPWSVYKLTNAQNGCREQIDAVP